MFHWICPECGREIAPGVKECPACDPHATPAQVATPGAQVVMPELVMPEKVLVPEIVQHDAEARLREMAGRMRGRAPEPGVRSAAPRAESPSNAAGLRPLAHPAAATGAPSMQQVLATPKIPDAGAQRLADSTLREPKVAAPPPASIRGARLDARPGPVNRGSVLLPSSSSSGKASEKVPHAAGIESIEEQMASRIRAAAPPTSKAPSNVERAETLPGPRLPHELSTFEGAGISRVLRAVPDAPQPPLGSSIPGWVVTTLVTATLLAGALSLAFYAMPGAASPRKVAAPASDLSPVSSGSASVEVTGIRIVAVAGKAPEIRYLVVNHADAVLDGATVNVTLRLIRASADDTPISRFSFAAPGLGAYEAREMVSPIQNMVVPGELPDWRNLRAEVQVEQ